MHAIQFKKTCGVHVRVGLTTSQKIRKISIFNNFKADVHALAWHMLCMSSETIRKQMRMHPRVSLCIWCMLIASFRSFSAHAQLVPSADITALQAFDALFPRAAERLSADPRVL